MLFSKKLRYSDISGKDDHEKSLFIFIYLYEKKYAS